MLVEIYKTLDNYSSSDKKIFEDKLNLLSRTAAKDGAFVPAIEKSIGSIFKINAHQDAASFANEVWLKGFGIDHYRNTPTEAIFFALLIEIGWNDVRSGSERIGVARIIEGGSKGSANPSGLRRLTARIREIDSKPTMIALYGDVILASVACDPSISALDNTLRFNAVVSAEDREASKDELQSAFDEGIHSTIAEADLIEFGFSVAIGSNVKYFKEVDCRYFQRGLGTLDLSGSTSSAVIKVSDDGLVAIEIPGIGFFNEHKFSSEEAQSLLSEVIGLPSYNSDVVISNNSPEWDFARALVEKQSLLVKEVMLPVTGQNVRVFAVKDGGAIYQGPSRRLQPDIVDNKNFSPLSELELSMFVDYLDKGRKGTFAGSAKEILYLAKNENAVIKAGRIVNARKYSSKKNYFDMIAERNEVADVLARNQGELKTQIELGDGIPLLQAKDVADSSNSSGLAMFDPNSKERRIGGIQFEIRRASTDPYRHSARVVGGEKVEGIFEKSYASVWEILERELDSIGEESFQKKYRSNYLPELDRVSLENAEFAYEIERTKRDTFQVFRNSANIRTLYSERHSLEFAQSDITQDIFYWQNKPLPPGRYILSEFKGIGFNGLSEKSATIEAKKRNSSESQKDVEWIVVDDLSNHNRFSILKVRTVTNSLAMLVEASAALPSLVDSVPGTQAIGMVKLDSDEFQKWFAGSQVTIGEAVPKIVYHGSLNHNISEFSESDFFGSGFFGKGINFTSSYEDASKYASKDVMVNLDLTGKASVMSSALNIEYSEAKSFLTKGDGTVYEAYLSIKNPLRLNDAPLTIDERIFTLAAAEADVDKDEIGRLYKVFSTAKTGVDQFELVVKWKATRIYRQIATLLGNDGLIIEPTIAPLGKGAEHYFVLDKSQVNISGSYTVQEAHDLSIDDSINAVDIFEIGQQVEVAGAVYTVVLRNAEGTYRLVNDEGVEFDTALGEAILPFLAPEISELPHPGAYARQEFIDANISLLKIARAVKLKEVMDAVQQLAIKVPEGMNKVHYLKAKSKLSKEEKRLLAQLNVAESNLAADYTSDKITAGAVWDKHHASVGAPDAIAESGVDEPSCLTEADAERLRADLKKISRDPEWGDTFRQSMFLKRINSAVSGDQSAYAWAMDWLKQLNAEESEVVGNVDLQGERTTQDTAHASESGGAITLDPIQPRYQAWLNTLEDISILSSAEFIQWISERSEEFQSIYKGSLKEKNAQYQSDFTKYIEDWSLQNLSDRVAKYAQNFNQKGSVEQVDVSYSDQGMFTAFYPESHQGIAIFNEIAYQTDGTGKVLTVHVDSVIQQIRSAGYIVAPFISVGDDISTDDLYRELTDSNNAASILDGTVSNHPRGLPIPSKFSNGSRSQPLEVQIEELSNFEIAEISDVGSENIYILKNKIYYFCKVGDVDSYSLGLWNFISNRKHDVANDHSVEPLKSDVSQTSDKWWFSASARKYAAVYLIKPSRKNNYLTIELNGVDEGSELQTRVATLKYTNSGVRSEFEGSLIDGLAWLVRKLQPLGHSIQDKSLTVAEAQEMLQLVKGVDYLFDNDPLSAKYMTEQELRSILVYQGIEVTYTDGVGDKILSAGLKLNDREALLENRFSRSWRLTEINNGDSIADYSSVNLTGLLEKYIDRAVTQQECAPDLNAECFSETSFETRDVSGYPVLVGDFVVSFKTGDIGQVVLDTNDANAVKLRLCKNIKSSATGLSEYSPEFVPINEGAISSFKDVSQSPSLLGHCELNKILCLSQRYAELCKGLNMLDNNCYYLGAVALVVKDHCVLDKISNGLNEQLGSLFTEYTGIKLPKNLAHRARIVHKWLGEDMSKSASATESNFDYDIHTKRDSNGFWSTDLDFIESFTYSQKQELVDRLTEDNDHRAALRVRANMMQMDVDFQNELEDFEKHCNKSRNDNSINSLLATRYESLVRHAESLADNVLADYIVNVQLADVFNDNLYRSVENFDSGADGIGVFQHNDGVQSLHTFAIRTGGQHKIFHSSVSADAALALVYENSPEIFDQYFKSMTNLTIAQNRSLVDLIHRYKDAGSSIYYSSHEALGDSAIVRVGDSEVMLLASDGSLQLLNGEQSKKATAVVSAIGKEQTLMAKNVYMSQAIDGIRLIVEAEYLRKSESMSQSNV